MATNSTEYAQEIADQIAEIRKDLAFLEKEGVTHSTKEAGGEWRDVTAEMIQRHRDNIAMYERILKAIENNQLPMA